MSTPIKMENGVKQGGVLSPTLFCIYFDELLRRLRETDVGCHVGHMSYAAFGYADDLLLLSPSIHGLEILVKTSESFASEYGVTFNAKKTECICFSKNACPLQRQVKVNGQHVKWKDKVKYLGIILTNDMCDDADIRAKRGEFIGSVNRLNAQFRVVPDQIRIRLLQTYCTAWYGCQTWLLNTTSVKGMNVEWKKAVRRTLNLPRTTRSKLVPLLEERVTTLITSYEPRRALRSAGAALLCVPRHNLERYGRRSFSCAGPALWNSLPETMRLADSLS